MNQQITQGIVLSRTNYGEADRIITLLTPDRGKLRVMARGVRKMKSKLAGGIELFSISDITYITGRGSLGTLISARLDKHYDTIVSSIDRVQLGYELLQLINKVTEDEPEPEYFSLLEQALQALDTPTIAVPLVRTWFEAQLLRLGGHAPNLHCDTAGDALQAEHRYNFDFDAMALVQHTAGLVNEKHIKSLRLLFSQHALPTIAQVQGIGPLVEDIAPVIRSMTGLHLAR